MSPRGKNASISFPPLFSFFSPRFLFLFFREIAGKSRVRRSTAAMGMKNCSRIIAFAAFFLNFCVCMRENGGGGCDGSPPVVVDEGKKKSLSVASGKEHCGLAQLSSSFPRRKERERSFLHTHTQVFELSKKGGEGVFLAWLLGLNYTVS